MLAGQKTGGLDDRWHHIACVFGLTSGGLKLYLDGELLPISSSTELSFDNIGTPSEVIIGKGFVGMIDEVCIIDKALDAAAVRRLMEAGSVN